MCGQSWLWFCSLLPEQVTSKFWMLWMLHVLPVLRPCYGFSVFVISFLFFFFQSGNIPIKLNAATIMREGVLFQKKEEEELKK